MVYTGRSTCSPGADRAATRMRHSSLRAAHNCSSSDDAHGARRPHADRRTAPRPQRVDAPHSTSHLSSRPRRRTSTYRLPSPSPRVARSPPHHPPHLPTSAQRVAHVASSCASSQRPVGRVRQRLRSNEKDRRTPPAAFFVSKESDRLMMFCLGAGAAAARSGRLTSVT